MKLSNTLLQAVFVGLTAGATLVSCDSPVLETIGEAEPLPKKIIDSKNDGGCNEGTCHNWDDCPACGLG